MRFFVIHKLTEGERGLPHVRHVRVSLSDGVAQTTDDVINMRDYLQIFSVLYCNSAEEDGDFIR